MSYTICSRFKGEHIVYAGYTICTSREHIVYGAFCGSTKLFICEAQFMSLYVIPLLASCTSIVYICFSKISSVCRVWVYPTNDDSTSPLRH